MWEVPSYQGDLGEEHFAAQEDRRNQEVPHLQVVLLVHPWVDLEGHEKHSLVASPPG